MKRSPSYSQREDIDIDQSIPRVDIRDVAKLARVSTATVSRTMNHHPSVNRAFANRVWKAVADLNYYPNTLARALVSGRSRIFGLIVSDITNPFFPELIKHFEEVAVRHDYEILISSTNYSSDLTKHCLRRMIERNVEGVAIMTFGVEDSILEEFSSRKIPMVFVDMARDISLSNTLKIDYFHGIREGVQHLAFLGHRMIGFISGPLSQHSAVQRKAAFIESVREIGCDVPPHWLIEGNHDLESGMQGAFQLLRDKKRPTAIMCSNDMTAIGALRVLLGNGLRVPEDISLIGFDDIHLAEFVNPPLTTISMSRADVADLAFRSLLSQVESLGIGLPDREWKVLTKLKIRQSTGPCPAGSH